MKKILIAITIALCCLDGYSQSTNKPGVKYPHITFANGTSVSPSYNHDNKTLTVQVSENTDELEVIVSNNVTVIEEEYTTSQEDQLDINLSGCTHHQLDIYIRTREEIHFVGSIEKEEE